MSTPLSLSSADPATSLVSSSTALKSPGDIVPSGFLISRTQTAVKNVVASGEEKANK